MYCKSKILFSLLLINLLSVNSFAQSLLDLQSLLGGKSPQLSNSLTPSQQTNSQQQQQLLTTQHDMEDKSEEDYYKELTINDISPIEKMFYLYETNDSELEFDLSTLFKQIEPENENESLNSENKNQEINSTDQLKNENIPIYYTSKKSSKTIKNNAIENKNTDLQTNQDNQLEDKDSLKNNTYKSKYLPKEEDIIDKDKVIFQYGYDIFNKNKSSNMMHNFIPVSDNYILGPNDSLIIRVWGKIEETFNLTIDKNGNIYLPKIGYITLAGSKYKETKKIIKKEFEKFYVNFDLSVTMGQLKSIKVFIVGEANNPGAYDIASMSTLFNALHTAGGVSKNGSLRNIQLKRNNKTIQTIDLYNYLIKGNNTEDPMLQSNDTIFIPPIGDVVKIDGGIKRPGIYEISPNTTAKELISSLASGLSANADKSTIKIKRIINKNRIVKDIDLSENANSTLTTTMIQNGDIVRIPKILSEQKNIVKIKGNIHRPGLYEFSNNMTLKDLISKADGIKQNTILNNVEVYRYSENNTRSLKFVNYEETPNFKLQALDLINILAEKDYYGEREVHIEGAVKNPGSYPLFKNLTLTELILLAKPKNEAILSQIELYRNTGDREFIKTFNLRAEESDFKLEENDIITIRYKQKFGPPKKVYLTGEVNFPGLYIAVENEKLSTILERAGGFTENAFLNGIVLKRKTAKNQEAAGYTKVLNEEKKRFIFDQSKLKLIKEMDTFSTSSLQFLEEKINEAEGRVVININSLKELKNSNHDITLENEDTLFIPSKPKSIQVVGGVQQPTALIYEKSKSPRYYVNLAGNFTNYADKRKIYVFRANGSIKLNPKVILPGDTIYIPESIKLKIEWFTILQTTLDTIIKAATSIALIESLNN